LRKVLRVSYSYERREFLFPGNYWGSISSIPGQSIAVVPLYKSDLHHLDVRVMVTGEKALRWETGLGVTALRSRSYLTVPFPPGSVMLPNIYVGYHWKLAHGRMLEVFLDSRGLIRNKTSDLPDIRRYYTLGGSFSL